MSLKFRNVLRSVALTAGAALALWSAASGAAGNTAAAPGVDPLDPQLVCRSFDGRAGRSDALRSLAASLGHDGDIQLAQAGSAKSDLEDNLDLFEKLGLMEGHLLIGKALLDAKMQKDALPHFGHPLSEIYDYLKPLLKERNVPDFEQDLRDLEARAKASPNDPGTTAAYNAVLTKIDGLRQTIPASLIGSHAFMIRGVALMMEASADDYGESVDKGSIRNVVEYHDALGFARYTEKLLAANTTLLGKDAAAVAIELKIILAALPGLTPPPTPVRSVADLEAAVSRIKELAK